MSYMVSSVGSYLDRFIQSAGGGGGGTPPPEGYADTVNGLAGGGPIAYWRLGTITTAVPGPVEIPVQADWTDHGGLIGAGGAGTWDVRTEGCGTPRIIKKGSTWFCFYGGADGNRVVDGGERHQSIGVATATSLSGPWTKYAGNPIITFRPNPTHQNEEEEAANIGGVFLDADGTFHMLWDGSTALEGVGQVRVDVFYSSSTDGFTWTNNNAATAVLVMEEGLAWAGHSSNELPCMGFHKHGTQWWVYYGPVGAISSNQGFVFSNAALPNSFLPANSNIALTVADNPLGGTFRRSSIIDRGDNQLELITVCFDPSPVVQSSLYTRVLPVTTPGNPSDTETEFFTLSGVHVMGVYLDRATSTWAMVTREENVTNTAPNHIWSAVMPSVGGGDIVDSIGSLDGTYAGTVVETPGLPANSDGSVNFAGIGTGLIAHDTAFDLTAFTLSFWFQANAPAMATTRSPILTKDQSGAEAGGFIVALQDDDTVLIEFQDGTTFQRIFSGVITLGEPHHIAIRADNTGFDVYLDGQFVQKSTGYTGAWSVNVDPIRLADATWAANDFDGRLDEIALYNRVLTEAEILELAQVTGGGGGEPILPFAADASVAVPESSASFLIGLPEGSTYVGAKDNLTVTVVSQPDSGSPSTDSVAVDGNNDFTYTSGAVAADTARSFTYKIADVNGESNTATVDVLVLNAGQPVVSNANCYAISSADTVVVSSMASLNTEINAAPPGRQILIAAGTYAGGTFTFAPSGTTANPIVVRPQGARGSVTINNCNWTLPNTSSSFVIASLFFNAAKISVSGVHHRISRCRFLQNGANGIIHLIASRDGRFDHLDFQGYTGDNAACVRLEAAGFSGANCRNLIDHCYFHDFNTPVRSRITRMFWNNTVVNNISLDTDHDVVTIDKCLFRNINATPGGFGEIILIKTGGHTTKFCTFENSDGYVQSRVGSNCEFRSNWFENVSATKCFGENHLVIGNRFVGSVLWVPAGDATQEQMLSQPTVYFDTYMRSRNCQIIGNRGSTNGFIRVGDTYLASQAVYPALDNNLFGNTSDAGGTAHVLVQLNSGTTFTNPGSSGDFAYTPAVKLLPANVGLEAPDPYCPSGPQS